MINRSALIIKYREPFVRWLNEVEPDLTDLSVEEANADNQVYLLDVDDADALQDWLDLNHALLFENELEGWCDDEERWPAVRDRATFDAWLHVECHTLLYDVGTGEIIDDDR